MSARFGEAAGPKPMTGIEACHLSRGNIYPLSGNRLSPLLRGQHGSTFQLYIVVPSVKSVCDNNQAFAVNYHSAM